MEEIRIYINGIKVAFAARMAYRMDFFISAFIMLTFEFIIPLVTLLIYGSGLSFPGWTLSEALLLQGVFLLSKGLAFPFFFGIVWNLMVRVREGTFDLLLIKPRSILFISIVTAFDCEDLGKLVGGIILFSVGLSKMSPPSIMQWSQFVLLFLLSQIVLFSFALLLSGSLFKWVGNSRVFEIFESVTSFGLYPKTIFSKGLQSFITMIIPVAMIGFFPASVLLGKPNEGIAAASIASIILLVASILFWHEMLKKYTSAGG